MWEIVWSNGQLYDVCDDHARLHEAVRYDACADGSLRAVAQDGRHRAEAARHASEGAQDSLLQESST
jgi:hypothetical protein